MSTAEGGETAAASRTTELVLRAVEPDEVDAVQELLESNPGYFARVTGHPPAPADALSLLVGRPEHLGADDKLVYGMWSGPLLVAVADVLRHWPDPSTAPLGLLLVRGDRRATGIGSRTLALLDREAATWPGVTQWRAAIVATNDVVTGFWTRQGFSATGETRPYRYDQLETEVTIYTRPVAAPHVTAPQVT